MGVKLSCSYLRSGGNRISWEGERTAVGGYHGGQKLLKRARSMKGGGLLGMIDKRLRLRGGTVNGGVEEIVRAFEGKEFRKERLC